MIIVVDLTYNRLVQYCHCTTIIKATYYLTSYNEVNYEKRDFKFQT